MLIIKTCQAPVRRPRLRTCPVPHGCELLVTKGTNPSYGIASSFDGKPDTMSITMSTANCAKCAISSKLCREQNGRGPDWCPTVTQAKLLEETLAEYDRPHNRELALQASRQEAEGYVHRQRTPFVSHPAKCRLEETLEFCQRMNFRRIGLAFCSGLSREAATLSLMLEKHGLDVVGVSCKVGGVPKERLGIGDDEKVRVGQYETMCNPIFQAAVLNAAATDFNVMLGLCVGHDALFLKHAQALTTVLAVKDRVTGHNPLAALYTLRSYYRRLGEPP
jgi:uncharacterized metal-binding protein